MTEDIWDIKPAICYMLDHFGKGQNFPYYNAKDMDAWLDNLKAKITQLNECLGEFESHEWCSHCIIEAKCAQITMHVKELKGLIKRNEDAVRAVQALTERVNEIEQEYIKKIEAIEALVANSGLVIRADKLKAILGIEGLEP